MITGLKAGRDSRDGTTRAFLHQTSSGERRVHTHSILTRTHFTTAGKSSEEKGPRGMYSPLTLSPSSFNPQLVAPRVIF